MIKVTLPSGKLVAVGFSHTTGNEALHPAKGSLVSEVIKVRYSHCMIVELDPLDDKKYSLITEGVARCSPKDNFVKEKGRRVALTAALIEEKPVLDGRGRPVHDRHGKPKIKLVSRGGITKDERKVLWEAYFNRSDLPSVPFPKMNEVDAVGVSA